MATVERIEQDLAALLEAIALFKVDFCSTYEHYLKLLGQAVRQQLILASYQICTQGYPESFLNLSFSQRQNLQQAVRALAKQAQAELLAHLETSPSLPDQENIMVDDTSIEDNPILSSTQEQLSTFETIQTDEDEILDVSKSTKNASPSPSQPEQLLEWQEQLELAITQTLKSLSLDTNRLLQKNSIIPDKLPPAILEAAVQVEGATEAIAGSPNLLNLLMEAENDDEEKEDATLMRIVAINLRLSELEFADPTLNAGRNQLRKLSARVSSFQREYNKKQREKAVAQAETAWRSSWFDD
jgi:hypothetical protein